MKKIVKDSTSLVYYYKAIVSIRRGSLAKRKGPQIVDLTC